MNIYRQLSGGGEFAGQQVNTFHAFVVAEFAGQFDGIVLNTLYKLRIFTKLFALTVGRDALVFHRVFQGFPIGHDQRTDLFTARADNNGLRDKRTLF